MKSSPTLQEKLDDQYYNMQLLARNIHCLRKKNGLTQAELARLAGIEYYIISKLEWRTPHINRGKPGYYNVTFRTVCLIARAFGISVSALCSETLCD